MRRAPRSPSRLPPRPLPPCPPRAQPRSPRARPALRVPHPLRLQAAFGSEPRHQAELARARIGGEDLWLLKPMSYMNRSGDPVRSVADYYKVPVESVLVAYDELDFPAGVVRLKQGGGAAGHNGMRDVIAHMGDAFWRLRIGIGHPGNRAAVLDYVLGRPPAVEAQLIHEALLAAADIVPLLLTEGAQVAMNRLHSRESAPGAPAAPANS